MTAITVVIPVWGRYCTQLEACVADIRAQSEPARIVVVDNSSDVPLPRLAKDIRLLRLAQRVSVGSARNAALSIVQTPYVLFADVDDRLLPGSLAFLLQQLNRRPELVAAVGKHALWNPLTGERRVEPRAPRPVVYRLQHARHVLALCSLALNVFPIVGCAALRTDAVRDAGGFGDGDIGEDWQLAAALVWRGPISFHRRLVRLYDVTGGSLWHQTHERDAFAAQLESFRRRLFADPEVPYLVRRLEPLFAWIHGRHAATLFRNGGFRPDVGEVTAARSAS
jgi:glycosyltransferase involved in cell wall biosynthesis